MYEIEEFLTTENHQLNIEKNKLFHIEFPGYAIRVLEGNI